MNTNPLISVIIPVLAPAPHIEKCLKSLIFQTYKNIELLCLLPDKTANCINLHQDKRLTVINYSNESIGEVLNKGIDLSQGKYISFVNPNDWVLLDLYSRFAIEIKDNYSDIYVFNANWYFENKTDIPMFHFFENSDSGNNAEIIFNNMYIENKIYKKNFLKEQDFNFIKNNEFCEILFNFQALTKTKSIKINPETFYRKRYITKFNNVTNKVFDIFKIAELITNYANKENLTERYFMELYTYFCNILYHYYDFCPNDSKQMYFYSMQEALNYYISIIPSKIEHVKAFEASSVLLNSSFDEFNRLKSHRC